MPDTFTLIQAVTVGSGGQAAIDFTSIPSTYTDLYVALSGRSTRSAASDFAQIQFNGSTANLSGRYLLGEGTISSFTDTSVYAYISAANATASTFGNAGYYIPNYTSSNNKSIFVNSVGENNSGTSGQFTLVFLAGLWSNSAAITSIKLVNISGNFAQHSTAYLYGIVKS
jgi:hypothetical protein